MILGSFWFMIFGFSSFGLSLGSWFSLYFDDFWRCFLSNFEMEI